MDASTVAEQMLFTTVRIETEGAAGSGVGTAFMLTYKSGSGEYPFLVTNKHVVAGAQRGKLTFVQGKDEKPLLGARYTLDMVDFEKGWFGHPDPEIDIAVTPMVPIARHIVKDGVTLFIRQIGMDMVPNEEAMGKLDALEEIVFIGYPVGIWDSTNFLPIIRRGTTATPVYVDFQGKKQFLIDASVFPGSSGSPVFLYDRGMHQERSGGVVLGGRLLFLGALASVFYHEETNKIQIVSVPTANIPVSTHRQMVDLGVVFKASVITETIEALLKTKGKGQAATTEPAGAAR